MDGPNPFPDHPHGLSRSLDFLYPMFFASPESEWTVSLQLESNARAAAHKNCSM